MLYHMAAGQPTHQTGQTRFTIKMLRAISGLSCWRSSPPSFGTRTRVSFSTGWSTIKQEVRFGGTAVGPVRCDGWGVRGR